MSRFDELLREKKMKILILVVLLCSTNYFKGVTTLDLSFIIVDHKNENFEPICVARKTMLNSAIGWIYPIPNTSKELPPTVTAFIPNILNDFACDFEPNSMCTNSWKTDKWKIDSKTDLILDTRWENFKTVFSSENSPENRIEIPNPFNLGFSVRTSDSVELLLCEGWHPEHYPCYSVNADASTHTMHLKKYPNGIPGNSSDLDEHKFVSSVLFEYEWRSFDLKIDVNDTISLQEVFSGRTILRFVDPEPLKPLYLFLRSRKPALWKLHSNQFLYMRESNLTNFGPKIATQSSDLCISLYVSQCDGCSMDFLVLENGAKRIVHQISGENKQSNWEFTSFTVNNVYDDTLQLYVNTELTNNLSKSAFWALDDVRICNTNELKVSKLLLNANSDKIACHALQHPKWRPNLQKVAVSNNVFPDIESVLMPSSVKLSWDSSQNLTPSLQYLISYKGNDICPNDLNRKRTKSVNYVITQDKEAVVSNLIPYTHYNFTFSYIFSNETKDLAINTLPTEIPTDEEIPTNVTILATHNEATILWKKPTCDKIYGPLFYALNISNEDLNFSKLIESAEVVHKISGLQPFTNYSVKIFTARSNENLFETSLTRTSVYNFITEPTVAGPPRNVEIYSADSESLSLRYDLPEKPGGVLKYVQVIYCDGLSFSRCSSNVTTIAECKLWKNKYCIDLNHLISVRPIDVSVSLKNWGTHRFGSEVKLVGSTFERVPGKPINVTFSVVNCNKYTEYCHLNITWGHPYFQNGTIKFFNIILNETNADGSKDVIQEMFIVDRKTYSSEYNYQIKYIPYSTHYDLSIQSANLAFRSNFTTVHVKTADIGDHIDQTPKLTAVTNSSLSFLLPKLDWRLNETIVTVIVQDYDRTKHPKEELKLMSDVLCNQFGETWVAAKMLLPADISEVLTVGDGDAHKAPAEEISFQNKLLQPDTQYCVTFVITNVYKQSQHTLVYYEKDVRTLAVREQNLQTNGRNSYVHLYILVVILVCVPLGFVVYRYYLKKRKRKGRTENPEENTYEELPFEEADNFAYNNTYDKLVHS